MSLQRNLANSLKAGNYVHAESFVLWIRGLETFNLADPNSFPNYWYQVRVSMACAWGKLNNVIAENLIDISYGDTAMGIQRCIRESGHRFNRGNRFYLLSIYFIELKNCSKRKKFLELCIILIALYSRD